MLVILSGRGLDAVYLVLGCTVMVLRIGVLEGLLGALMGIDLKSVAERDVEFMLEPFFNLDDSRTGGEDVPVGTYENLVFAQRNLGDFLSHFRDVLESGQVVG